MFTPAFTRARIWFLLLLCIFLTDFLPAQTVNIFIHRWTDGTYLFPSQTAIQTAYGPYYTTVNVTIGTIPSTLGALNGYDAVYICELNFSSINMLLNATQTSVVSNYIQNGGDVVWIAENSPSAPGTNNVMTVVNNLFGVALTRVAGLGNPVVPFHGSPGPAGLTQGVTSLSTTSSYDYFTGPAALPRQCFLAFSAGSCTQSSVQGMAFMFPGPFLCDLRGTLLVYGEVQMYSSLMTGGQYATHYGNVARMHRALNTGNLTQLQTWNSGYTQNAACGTAPPCTVLPAEMLIFAVEADGPGRARAHWRVQQAYGVQGYRVEHAAPGRDFTEAGFVSAGTASEEAYSFPVTGLEKGLHRFRIRTVDMNGQEVLSTERTLIVTESAGFEVWPSQVLAGVSDLHVRGTLEGELTAELLDLRGRSLVTLWQGTCQGEMQFRAPAELAPGLYFIRVRTAAGAWVKRIEVIQ